MTIRRAGVMQDLIVTAVEDPTVELVPTEINRPLTESERFLRNAWLNSKR
jgi:hypothetical protein